jgi:hypothetical protein
MSYALLGLHFVHNYNENSKFSKSSGFSCSVSFGAEKEVEAIKRSKAFGQA